LKQLQMSRPTCGRSTRGRKLP